MGQIRGWNILVIFFSGTFLGFGSGGKLRDFCSERNFEGFCSGAILGAFSFFVQGPSSSVSSVFLEFWKVMKPNFFIFFFSNL
ncbi:unnamed protein product [Meloidogyne enterolobii]|uniref:Uncharacterized protein n=1 Tax=Meloidogyne enterolobii TaxID=390850 RepID=A0ACB1AAT4_MELEN